MNVARPDSIAAQTAWSPTRAAADRIQGLDYLRVAAVFAVVWIHGSDTNSLAQWLQTYAGFAVPCFIMVSAYLMQQRAIDGRYSAYGTLIGSRLLRLLPAYLAWTGVYLLLRWFKHVWLMGEPEFAVDWVLAVLCGGSSYQLWFIPALVIYTIVFGVIVIGMGRRAPGGGLLVALFIGGAALLVLGMSIAKTLQVAPGYELFVRSTLAYAGYYVLGLTICLAAQRSVVQRLHPVVPGAIAALLGSVLQRAATFAGAAHAAFVFVLFVAAERLRGSTRGPLLRALSRCALGIYMAHAMFVEGLQMVLPRLGFNLAVFETTVFVIVAAFVMSAALCVLLSLRRTTRWLVK